MKNQELAEAVVNGMLSKDEFSKWLDIKTISIKPGECVLQMKIRKEMLNGFFVCHGGIPYSLADSALAFASNTCGTVNVAISNSIQYPAAVSHGDILTAKAQKKSTTNRLGFYEVVITKQDNTVVGVFSGTVYNTQKEHKL